MWLTDRLFRKQGRHARAPTVRPRGFQTALSTKEKWQLVAEWAVLSGVGAWLFYDSWWALLPLAVCFPFYRRFRREALLRKRRMRYASEFQEGMQAMAASIRAGDSAERAVLEALKDLRSIHGKDTAMMEELELMTRELSMNRTPEQLLSELADRSGLEDAVCFADIFHAAKRTGGNLVQIMEQTADIMEARETDHVYDSLWHYSVYPDRFTGISGRTLSLWCRDMHDDIVSCYLCSGSLPGRSGVAD